MGLITREMVIRALKVCVVVGTILNLINQGKVITDGASLDLPRLLLTYSVPFCVAMYAAIMQRKSADEQAPE